MSERLTGHDVYAQPRNFMEEFNRILTTPLTAENYTNYADHALDKLIDLDTDVRDTYTRESNTPVTDGRELEDAAFKHFGLPDIDQVILPHLIVQSDLVKHIGDKVRTAQENPEDHVILPPDEREVHITPGDGSFNKGKPPVPRTQMLMYILKNEFDVDLDDPEQFKIVAGIVPKGSMREESYNVIQTKFKEENGKTQQRLIFVNNAPENATFVINSEVAFKTIGENYVDDLAKRHKTDLRNLFIEHPVLGQAMEYGKYWHRRLLQILRSPETEIRGNADDETPNYLVPRLGEGETTVSGISKKLRLGGKSVDDFIAEDNFPSVGLRRVGSQIAMAYNGAELETALRKGGVLVDRPEDNEYSLGGLCDKHKIDRSVAKKILAGSAIEPKGFRSIRNHKVPVYDESKFITAFQKSEYFGVEEPKENEISIKGMHDETGVNDTVLKKLAIKHNLSKIARRKGPSTYFDVYDRKEFYKILEAEGFIKPPFMRCVREFSVLIGKNDSQVRAALKSRGLLEGLPKYMFSGALAPGLDVNTQLKYLELLHDYIRMIGKREVPFISNENYSRVLEQLLHEKAELEAMKKEPEENTEADEAALLPQENVNAVLGSIATYLSAPEAIKPIG